MEILLFVVLFAVISIFIALGIASYKKSQRAKEALKQKQSARIEQLTYLKGMLSNSIKEQEPFYPDSLFYSGYKSNHVTGLHHMAEVIFDWLKIKPDGVRIDFYNIKDFPQSGGDTAGFFTKTKNYDGTETELIYINKKYEGDPLQVGAILAHEMMHLYLGRLNLVHTDRASNELMTDLATVRTGLGILILNGFYYSNSAYLTLILLCFGVFHWRETQIAFGYFKPYEYGREVNMYLNDQHLTSKDIMGYMSPNARRYIPHKRFDSVKSKTDYIRNLNKKSIRSQVIQGIILLAVIAFVIYSNINSSNNPSSTTTASVSAYKQNLGTEIDQCQTDVATQKTTFETENQEVQTLDNQMQQYQDNNDTVDYNADVTSYNNLLEKAKTDYQTYSNSVDSCNNLVNQYNAAN
jgi:type II secretory pathway pseudopilin PulG